MERSEIRGSMRRRDHMNRREDWIASSLRSSQ
jgi:hypothetical protein